jgi:hypothetical protein
MPKKPKASVKNAEEKLMIDLIKVAEKTDRKELFDIKGDTVALTVYRVPTKYLFFNIENGRYADKMLQLRDDNPGVEIDPREEQWKKTIKTMLEGSYPGTAVDKEPFQRLRADILASRQRRPGVVLNDGGVLDGNRRLAVLLDLAGSSEPNPSRFEWLDAVILPSNVGPEDRWRIEAGLQIGKDEKHEYSPINQLLKIREGLKIFTGAEKPEQEIAKNLYGITEKEIKKDILKISLIDEYLEFIGKPGAYNEVSESRVVERFEEAVDIVERGKSLPLERYKRVKPTIFALIRDQTMTNYDMRKIGRAMGGKGKSAIYKNEKALDELLKIGSDLKQLRTALRVNTDKSSRNKAHKERSEQFLERMQATEAINNPLKLADRAKISLETLLDALAPLEGKKHDDWQQTMASLDITLKSISKLSENCSRAIKKIGIRVVKKAR